MRFLGVLLALVLACAGPAHAQIYGYHHGQAVPGPVGASGTGGGSQPPINPTPTLQDNTVNFGAQTRADQGAVPPYNLMAASNSAQANTWTICQVTGTQGDWEIRVANGSSVTVPNCTPGPAATFNDPTTNAATGGYIVAPTTAAAQTDLHCGVGCTTNAPAIATFHLTATNASGTSAQHTLTINRKAFGANISQAIAPQGWPWTLNGTTTPNSLVGDGTTNTFQQFVSVCRPNCFIAFSTGTQGFNPAITSTAPGQGFQGTGWTYQFNSFNYGAMVNAVLGGGTAAPGAGEMLTWEDADSIGDGGTPTGTSRHATFDSLEFNGTPPSGQAGVAWGCTPQPVGGVVGWATTSTTYNEAHDLTMGGNQQSNPAHSFHNGLWYQGACNSGADYIFGGYAFTRDGTYNVTSETFNPLTHFVFAPIMVGNQNLNLNFNYITCVVVFACYGDNGSTTSLSLQSSNITINHLWARYFPQHAISTSYAANVTINDCYLFSPYQAPNTTIHVDFIQTTDNLNAPNLSLNRCMTINADSNVYGLALFAGNTNHTTDPKKQGWKINWIIDFNKEYAGLVWQSMDSLTTRQAELQYMTIVRENGVTDPSDLSNFQNYTVGTNIGAMNAGTTFVAGNAQNGDTWALTQCTLSPAAGSPPTAGTNCGSNPTTTIGTFTFVSPVNYTGALGQIMIGPYRCNNTTDTAPCLALGDPNNQNSGNSTLMNFQIALGITTDTATLQTCQSQTALSVAWGICMQTGWAAEAGLGPGATIITTIPPGNLINEALVPGGPSCATKCFAPNVRFGNILLGNYPSYPLGTNGIWLEGATSFTQSGPCTTSVFYCGLIHMNSIFVWDNFFPCPNSSFSSTCSYYDPASSMTNVVGTGAGQAGLGNIATVDQVPGLPGVYNAYYAGSRCGEMGTTAPCSLGAAVGNITGNFTADGTAGAETNAESHPYTFYQAKGAKSLVAFFAGLVCPVAGGHLDPKGDQSVATGALDFACNWNGYGQPPGWDLVNDAVNPWPH